MTDKILGPDANVAPKVKKKNNLIIVVIILGLILGLDFSYRNNGIVAKVLSNDSKEVKLQSLPLNEFLVNLSDANYRRYLKVSLVVEFKEEETAEEIEGKSHIVRDAIISLLTSKSVADINSVKGKEILKKELVREVNSNLKDGQIESLYWTDFVIQ